MRDARNGQGEFSPHYPRVGFAHGLLIFARGAYFARTRRGYSEWRLGALLAMLGIIIHERTRGDHGGGGVLRHVCNVRCDGARDHGLRHVPAAGALRNLPTDNAGHNRPDAARGADTRPDHAGSSF